MPLSNAIAMSALNWKPNKYELFKPDNETDRHNFPIALKRMTLQTSLGAHGPGGTPTPQY